MELFRDCTWCEIELFQYLSTGMWGEWGARVRLGRFTFELSWQRGR